MRRVTAAAAVIVGALILAGVISPPFWLTGAVVGAIAAAGLAVDVRELRRERRESRKGGAS